MEKITQEKLDAAIDFAMAAENEGLVDEFLSTVAPLDIGRNLQLDILQGVTGREIYEAALFHGFVLGGGYDSKAE